MINTFLSATLSKAINAYLHLDSESSGKLKVLQGKVIRIELAPFHWQFDCVMQETKMEIMPASDAAPHATIKGTPLQLAGMALTKENRQRFFAEDVEMTGDAALAQEVVNLFDELQIDWEEQVAHLTGDVPAYHLGRFASRVKGWLKTSTISCQQDITDYIQEEAKWLPTREALTDFLNDIDLVRADVDRLEARVNLLKQKLGEGMSDI